MAAEQLPTGEKGSLYPGKNEYARLTTEQTEGFNNVTDPAKAYEMADADPSNEAVAESSPQDKEYDRLAKEQREGFNKEANPVRAYEMARAAIPKMKEALDAEAKAREMIEDAAKTKGMPLGRFQESADTIGSVTNRKITDLSGIFEAGAQVQRDTAARHRDKAGYEMDHAGRVYDVGEAMANAERDEKAEDHEVSMRSGERMENRRLGLDKTQDAPALEREGAAIRKAQDDRILARYEAELTQGTQSGQTGDRVAQAREKVKKFLKRLWYDLGKH